MKKKTFILGIGSHSKLIYNCLRKGKKKIKVDGFIYFKSKVAKKTWIGKIFKLPVYDIKEIPINSNIYIGIGDHILRSEIYNKIKRKFNFPNYVSNNSVIADGVKIGKASIILDGCVLNYNSHISENSIINTGSIIEHDVKIGNSCNISPGSIICGKTVIEENCLIGAGSIIQDGIHIKKNSLIGSGSNVVKNVKSNSLLFGNPAKNKK